ncbi:MAG TPA: LysR family transcriptional regulator [Nocardioidaceae bacterium]|nr:LysR family transcriptional regulator [Nocardioidaceae bacterium]
MTERPPDLEDLSLLVLVAQTGSIGQAASRMGLSQPSVSRRMAALERRLRVPLLTRSRRGTALTPAGRAVVDWAEGLLDAADGFIRSVQALRVHERGALALAVSMTIAEHYAPAWLRLLRQRLPDLKVALTVANSTEVTDLVLAGRADLGFVEYPTPPRGVRTRRVGRDELVVAVTPDHPWATRRAVAADELATTPLLVREPGSGTRETLRHALERLGLELSPGLETASNAALRSVALAGMGPVVLSSRALADEISAGQLVAVAVRDLDLGRPLTAVWGKDVELVPAALTLLRIARSGPVIPAA